MRGTGTLNLGAYEADTADPVRKEVTYTNTTTRTVWLDLDLDLRGRDGESTPAPGSVALGQTTVDIAPGTTATVPIMVDLPKVQSGHYSGYLNATGLDGTVIHTTVALLKNPHKHKVMLNAIAPDGTQGNTLGLFMFTEDMRYDYIGSLAPYPLEVEFPQGQHC